ncbi:YEF3 [Symbiodinium sp. KB8]|nr:YEF3 [Symbiodinium sp. KB8]
MAGIAPTKKNKAEITAVKDQIELLQVDGNYRAALGYVRKLEEEERDKRRAEREKDDEEALAAGLGKKKGPSEPAPKKQAAAASSSTEEATAASSGPFEGDAEVVAVVKSAVEGSDEALAQLQKGAGAGSYKSTIKAEVASIAAGAAELISAKMKRAATRDGALKTVRALTWNPPAVLPALPALLLLLEEAKLKTEPGGTALDLCRHVCKAGPRGSCLPEMVLPVLLAHLGPAAAGKWKVKVACLGLLRDLLAQATASCPRQLGLWMPKVMSSLRDAVGDARKEVKKEAESFLRNMAKELAATPEIRALADDIIASIVDSANMEKAGETLHRMANTTFLNTVDSCAFALLFPTVARAMREQAHEAKMKGVQIVGASVNLIADPVLLQPYLQELMPLLQECLLHPTIGVQHEAAKSFGSLAFGLPEICDRDMVPFLLKTLASAETNDDVSEVERRGAARGLAEVLLARRDLLSGCLHEDVLPRIPSGPTKEAKAGGLQLIQATAADGVLHIFWCPGAEGRNALQEESEVVHKQAVAAVRVLIDEYGATAPHLLLPRMQEALFFEDEESRTRAMDLFFAFCEKISEGMKFGQDFLTMDCLSQFHRHSLLSSIFIARTDDHHDVRRVATLLWKEKLQSGPKAKAEILPLLLSVLKALQSGHPSQAKAAELCLKELEVGHGGVIFAENAADVETLAEETKAEREAAEKPPPLRAQLLQSRAKEGLAELSFPEPLRALESKTRDGADEAIEEERPPIAVGSAIAAFGLKSFLDKVGRNGAGKTTLMSTIAARGVSGMSADVKTLHVKPEVNELSGGWRMKLLLASDKQSVEWLSNYLRMVISHDPVFLNKVCTDIIQQPSCRHEHLHVMGNFEEFRKARRISSDEETVEEDHKASGGVASAVFDKASKISFPIPGTLKGHSTSRKDISCKIGLTSRIGIVGANGAGKSTLLNVLCGELLPVPGPDGQSPGEVYKHRNLRLAYIAQQHMFHLAEFMNSTPYVYIQKRYQNGYDEALQRRLMEPANEEEAKRINDLARKYGKYGFEVGSIQSRVVRGNEVLYEVQWKGCDDPKQNTFENLSKLKKLGVVGLAKAYDERLAAQTAGIDQRPLTQKEIVKHLEQFGLDEDMILHRQIGSFSAGQKSKLTLGAAFWTKPHLIALDEPTNYIDMETLDALVQGLARYKGGIIVISHASEFVNQVCTEIWKVEGGGIAERTKQELKK